MWYVVLVLYYCWGFGVWGSCAGRVFEGLEGIDGIWAGMGEMKTDVCGWGGVDKSGRSE